MSSNWTTVSSHIEKVEDSNPAVWYNAAFSASTWEEALRFYEKAEYYYRNDDDYEHLGCKRYSKAQLFIRYHRKKLLVCLCLLLCIAFKYSTFIKQSLTVVLSYLAHLCGENTEKVALVLLFNGLLLFFTLNIAHDAYNSSMETKTVAFIELLMIVVLILMIIVPILWYIF